MKNSDEIVKVGFIGFGEVNTPKDIIEKMLLQAIKKLKHTGLELVTTEYVSNDPQRQDAERAITKLTGKEFDLLIICIAGWIPTHTIIQVTDNFKEKPMILWGLGGYYKNGILFTTAGQAGTSAARKVFEDLGYDYKYIYNTPDSFCDMSQISDFAKVAASKRLLRSSRIGMMGFRDMKLYSTLYDGVSLRREIGPEVEFFEMLEISRKMEKIPKRKIEEIIKVVKNKYYFKNNIEDKHLEEPVKLYIALKQKIYDEKYDGVSLSDVDGVKKLLNFTPALTFMLMTDELGICTIPENDTLGLVTQLIIKKLTGQIGAYLEFYEFFSDRIIAGVPDYVPSTVVDGNTELMINSFGNLGMGVLNVSKLKTGKITMARLTSYKGRYAMHIVTGEAVEPPRWVEVGWDDPPQLPGLEIILDVPTKEFAEKVASQHYIISYGDNVEILKDYCRLCNIEMII